MSSNATVIGNTHPLVILFLRDLLHLVEKLPDAKLELGQLFLLRDVGVVDGVLSDLDVKVHSLEKDVIFVCMSLQA